MLRPLHGYPHMWRIGLTSEGFAVPLLALVSLAASISCGVPPAHRPPAQAPSDPPAQHTDPKQPSTAPLGHQGSGKTLADCRSALDRYEQGVNPTAVGASIAELMDGVARLVTLGGSDPRARSELEDRRKRLGKELVADPVNVSSRKVDIYVEICRQTGAQAEALGV